MYKIAAIAIALASTAVAPAANSAQTTPQVATPSDFSCALRLAVQIGKAREISEDNTKSPEARSEAVTVVNNSRIALVYYVGRLGPEFSATNHWTETIALTKSFNATPSDIRDAEMAICMSNTEVAFKKALRAMRDPSNN